QHDQEADEQGKRQLRTIGRHSLRHFPTCKVGASPRSASPIGRNLKGGAGMHTHTELWLLNSHVRVRNAASGPPSNSSLSAKTFPAHSNKTAPITLGVELSGAGILRCVKDRFHMRSDSRRHRQLPSPRH